MIKFDSRQINIFLFRYRKILIALGISFLVWNFSQTSSTGKTVLVAKEYIPENSRLIQSQFSQVQISNFDTDGFFTDLSEVELNYANQDISAGSLVSREQVKQDVDFLDRLDVFVSIENVGEISPGTKIHLWSAADEFKRLISSEAVVRSSRTDNYKTHLIVSLPKIDEYDFMQANEVKISLVN